MRIQTFLIIGFLVAGFTQSAFAARISDAYKQCFPSAEFKFESVKRGVLPGWAQACEAALVFAAKGSQANPEVVLNLYVTAARVAYLQADYDLARTYISKAKGLSGLATKGPADYSRTEMAIALLDIIVGDGEGNSRLEDVVEHARRLSDARPYHYDAQLLLLSVAQRVKKKGSTLFGATSGMVKKSAYDDLETALRRMMALRPDFGTLTNFVTVRRVQGDLETGVNAYRYWVGSGMYPRDVAFLRLSELAFEQGMPDLATRYFELYAANREADPSWRSELFPEFPELQDKDGLVLPSYMKRSLSASDDALKDLLRALSAQHKGDMATASRMEKYLRCKTDLCLAFLRDMALSRGEEEVAAKWARKLDQSQAGVSVTTISIEGNNDRLDRFVRWLDVPSIDTVFAGSRKKSRRWKSKVKFTKGGVSVEGVISDAPGYGKSVGIGRGLNLSPSSWGIEQLVLQAKQAAGTKGMQAMMLKQTTPENFKLPIRGRLDFEAVQTGVTNVGLKLVPWRWTDIES